MHKSYRILIVICCILVAFCSFVACNPTPIEILPVTLNYIFVDFTSSIAFEFNDNVELVSKKAFDQDGEELLNKISSEYVYMEDIIKNLLFVFEENGYFEADSEKILFTSSATPIAHKVLSHISVIYEEFISSRGYNNKALYQVSNFSDEQLLKALNEDSVSVGKLTLLYNLHPELTDIQVLEKVDSVSYNDLLVDAVLLDNVYTEYFLLTIDDEVLIDSFTAKNLALKKLKEDELDYYYSISNIEMDVINSKVVWTVELVNNGDIYCFIIDAITSDIVSFDSLIHSKGNKINANKLPNEALDFALVHAGLSIDEIISYSISIEQNLSNLPYYLINFKTRFSKFCYEINANTGEVIAFDYRSHNLRDVDAKYGNISENEAIEIVKNRALLTNVSMLSTRLGYDGGWIYYVDFYVGDDYYYGEVNAKSGIIMEYNTTASDNTSEDECISSSVAKSIAYEMAGRGYYITDSDTQSLSVVLRKIKVDGETTLVYEVKFIYNEEMYSYTINAFDGIVIYEDKEDAKLDISSGMTQHEALSIVKNQLNISNDLPLLANIVYQARNGRDYAKYQIEFYYNEVNYYFVVDVNGYILEYERSF